MKIRCLLLLLPWLLATAVLRSAAAEPTPYHGTPHLTSTRIEAEHFDHGGQGVAYRGLGAVVTNVVYYPWVNLTLTNEYSPIPRERPDADIGVARQDFSGDTNLHLALRESEWTIYTFSVAQTGYHTIQVKTRGEWLAPGYVEGCSKGPSLLKGGATFQVDVDGRQVGQTSNSATNVVLPRIWLEAGDHRLKLTAQRVADTMLETLDAYRIYWFPPGFWPEHTFMVDWLRIIPAAVPRRAELLAGGTQGFINGERAAAYFSSPLIVGETPGNELLVHDQGNAAFRLVSRAGEVRTLAGHPGNPPGAGQGTNAGFATIMQTLVLADGSLFVLQDQGGTNNIVSQINLSGDVTIRFQGPGIVDGESRQLNFANLTNLPVMFSRIETNAVGELEAVAEYTEHFFTPCKQILMRVAEPRTARFRITTTGQAELLSVSRTDPTPRDPGAAGGGYRTERGALYLRDEIGFQEKVGLELHTAFLAKDGTLWGSFEHRLMNLIPDPSIRYLTVQTSPDGYVEGPQERAVSELDEQLLRAVTAKQFRVFSHWSDGNTENPRLLRLGRDTSLTPHFMIQPPENHGIHPASLVHAVTGQPTELVRFSLIGPASGDPSFKYRVEYSDDLVTWRLLAYSVQVLDNAGLISGGHVLANQPTTTLEVSTFYQTPRRYYRARLVVE